MLGGVMVDDAVLPAAGHLTGRHARHVLTAALGAVGGELEDVKPSYLHYQPGHDVVVRFDGRVRWGGGEPANETLIAATRHDGPPPGTLPVEAVTDAGDVLAVGVWRWPFDPVLSGLTAAVTPSAAAEFAAEHAVGRLRLQVVTYRPMQRAVVRATDEDGRVSYLKAVRPADVVELVERHRALGAAGLPVPEILRSDEERGLVLMTALEGPTVRDRIKLGHRILPGPEQYEELYERLAAVDLPGARPVLGRVAAASRHGAMLASVLPSQAGRIERLSAQLEPAVARAEARSGQFVHGDLHEAQLVTGRGRWGAATITGVLDLDDAGPGDPLGDRATVIAHLLERVVDSPRDADPNLVGYLRRLRSAFGERVGAAELDIVIAGVLVGLATGPFRVQSRRWQQTTRRRLALAERMLADPGRRTLRIWR
jgi:aminoglycoside phosphotransferase (APT) family kinase protein